MKVKNINGTSQNICSCNSWLQHWRNFSRQTTVACRALGCFRTDIVGTQVQKDIEYDNEWYIVPFCKSHHNATGPVELVAGTKLVSVNKKMKNEKITSQ